MTALPCKQTLPVIDITPLRDLDASGAAMARCAQEIRQACLESGVFYITGHGIPDAHRAELFSAAEEFFASPQEVKDALSLKKSAQFRGYTSMYGEITAGKADWHECLDVQPLASRLQPGTLSPDNHVLDDLGQWPAGLPDFSRVIMQTWDDRLALARRLVKGFALSLDLPAGHFDQFHGLDLCDLRLSYYPAVEYPPSDETALGMNAHVDLGFLAILDQDETSGLQVLQGDVWREAIPRPGTYLVNIGLMMQRWTNDAYRATWHRVRLSRGKDRYSAPFFYEPRPDAVVEPLSVCCGPHNPPAYPPCTVGEYFDKAFTTAYLDPVA